VATRVTSTRFVGRGAELAELEAALADAAAGRPSLALVAGESGVGKTRLLAELTRRARDAGARTLTGDAVELGEGELPYAPLVAALRPLARGGDPVLAALPEAVRTELGRLLPALDTGVAAGSAADPGAQARLFEALLTLLDRLGEDAPVLLVLEDLHWADRSTRAFLAFLARALCRERVLVVGSYRTDELHRRHPLRPLLAELERATGVRRLELAPLSREDLADALGDILGAPPAPELVERLHARSDGNPLYMEELLAAGLDGRGALPSTLRDALMVRIERLAEATQELLRVLAVGGRLDHDLLAAASGLEPRVLRESLREAVASHLVVVDEEGGHAFRHALLREVVQDDLLPGERTELHRALAHALEARAAAGHAGAYVSAGIAHHRYAAGDQPAALAASVRAADAAEAVHAHGEAATLLERALELWTRVEDPASLAGTDHPGLLARAADAHFLGGDRTRAEALLRTALDEVDAAREGRRAAGLLARLARVQWNLNRASEALDSVRRGLALVANDGLTVEQARLLAWLAKVRMLQGRHRESVELAREAQAVAEETGDGASLSQALNALGTSLISLGDVDEGDAALRRAMDVALARDDPRECDSAAVNLADALHLAGRSRAALAVANEALARLAGSPHPKRWLLLMRGEIAFDLGDWETAQRSLPTDDRRLDGRTLLNAELRRIHLAMAAGEHDDAAERLERITSTAVATTEPQFIAPAGALLAELRRRQGDLAGARAAVAETLDRLEFCTEDVGRLAMVAAVGVAVEAEVAQRARDLGDAGEAARALAHAEALLERVRAAAQDGRPVEAAHLATAEAEVTRAAGHSDPATWDAAARAWEAVERPYPAALARWRQAEAHLARDERGPAASTVAAALAVARRLGATWLASELEGLASRARLRLDGAAAPGAAAPEPAAEPAAEDPFGLTPRERQVLALVARGATNREIGAELYMAEKTASVHVSRILAKLDVRSRTQAAAVAHRLGLTAETTV